MSLKSFYVKFKETNGYKMLNGEQKEFCELFFARKNLFLTGDAGTGKSKVLNNIFDFLSKNGYYIGVTASTGVAALNIGGSTIHSFAGIGLGDEDVNTLLNKIAKNKKAKNRIRSIQTLFIDEISMISKELFEKLERVFRTMRFSNQPWGGVQLVLSGDFLQLKSINKNNFEDCGFCFDAKAWSEAKIQTFQLTEIMRQKGDSPFAEFLRKLRLAEVDDFSILEDCYKREFVNKTPIKIFCKNADIDKYNKEKLNQLPGQLKTYYAQTEGDLNLIQYFDKNCPAPKVLELKKGAQVVLLVNADVEGGLVNGSLGIIDGFTTEGPVVKFYSGRQEIIANNEWEIKEQFVDANGQLKYKTIATRIQIPLRLAYATSVHKSQGQTLDCAEIDLNEAWSEGQHYVAISRVRKPEDLKLERFDYNQIKANPECVNFYRNPRLLQ